MREGAPSGKPARDVLILFLAFVKALIELELGFGPDRTSS
jgi:hypothetical protein